MTSISLIPTITPEQNYHLTKTFLDIFLTGSLFLPIGIPLCLLFKNKTRALAIITGFGVGTAWEKNGNDFFGKRYHLIHGYHHSK